MRRAFTLIEILLTVALLGLLSAALVSGAVRMIGDQPTSPDEVFWKAVRTARNLSLQSETESRLSYDAKAKAFTVRSSTKIESLPLPEIRDLSVALLQAQASGGSVLIGGQLVDTRTLASVTFHPDGTCQPFRAQFRTTGPARVIAVDPWTCAAILESKKN